MFSKIFLSILLLTYVYTYTLKTLKDNNSTNFPKLPDNFNFKLNEIQTVKPNLEALTAINALRTYIRMLFGWRVGRKLRLAKIDEKVLFGETLYEKFKFCSSIGDQQKFFNEDLLVELKEHMNEEEQKEIETEFHNYMDQIIDTKIITMYLGRCLNYLEGIKKD